MSSGCAPGSGLRSTDPVRAIQSLETLVKRFQEEELGEGGEASGGNVTNDKVCYLINALKAKAEEPEILPLSSVDFDVLEERFHIILTETLVRRGNHGDRAKESKAQGGKTYMSSEGLYHHLDKLENLIPKSNEVGPRLWIDATFARVSAMLPTNQRMVLTIEQHIPPVDMPGDTVPITLSGAIDYAVFTMESRKHEWFLQASDFPYVKQQKAKGLFITKVKQALPEHVPQAVAKMYASARYLGKPIARGALTNGHEWIFMTLNINQDGIGGTYTMSPKIKIQASESYPFHVLSPEPDIIAGVLAYWIEHSYVDLDENDWFSVINENH
ncbi:hypothetical protein DFP72DRAFT_968735 [Ephemerocybe angulata]|uniref:Uncharacterized protein n=1 Tax=Ephemerocybe angulata TaxID=980116 RepID=A0A8H6M3W9_9AGAR|nr:hypothetical protein DFP72DRAFT_968735 [Tulosesus angulatus]